MIKTFNPEVIARTDPLERVIDRANRNFLLLGNSLNSINSEILASRRGQQTITGSSSTSSGGGGGTTVGPGTVGTLAMFGPSANKIQDSLASQAGSTITVAGSLTVDVQVDTPLITHTVITLGGNAYYTVSNQIKMDDSANISIVGGDYADINIITGTTTRATFDGEGSISFIGTAFTFQIPNNNNNLFTIWDGTNNYLDIDTLTPAINLGSTALNPTLTLLGTGLTTLGGNLVIPTGNVSIGKAAFEAWATNYSVLQLGGNSAFIHHTAEGASGAFRILQNAIYKDDSKYYAISTDEASGYTQTNGTHTFRVSNATVTADAEITFINPLTIQNDGSIDISTYQIGNDASAGGLSFSAAHLATFSHNVAITGLTANTVVYSGASSVLTSLAIPAATSLLQQTAAGVLSWVTASSASGITIDTTAITGGTAGRVLFESATNKVSEDADFTFSVNTLTVTGLVVGSSKLTLDGGGTNIDPTLSGANSTTNVSNVTLYPGSGTNVVMGLWFVPKGVGVATYRAQMLFFNTDYIADSTNYDMLRIYSTGTSYSFNSEIGGTGTLRPIIFSIAGSACLTINAASTITANQGFTAASTLTVTGAATFNGTAEFNSTSQFDDTPTVTGGVNLVFGGISSDASMALGSNAAGAAANAVVMLRANSGTNTGTTLIFCPRGTGLAGYRAQMWFANTDYSADTTNYELLRFNATGTAYAISSEIGGTGTLRPINFIMSATTCWTLAIDYTTDFIVPDATAAAFEIKEGANNIFKADTLNGSELVTIGSAGLQYDLSVFGDVNLFPGATTGITPVLTINGYMTGDALRSATIGISTTHLNSLMHGGVDVYSFKCVSTDATVGWPILRLDNICISVSAGDTIGVIDWYNRDTGLFGLVGKIALVATSTFSVNANTDMTFHTNVGAAGTLTEVLRLSSVLLATFAGGVKIATTLTTDGGGIITLNVPDSNAAAFLMQKLGGDDILKVATDTPLISIGNTTTNFPVTFLGTGLVTVRGGLTVTGTTTLNGAMNFGDATTDIITPIGTWDNNIYFKDDKTFYIGIDSADASDGGGLYLLGHDGTANLLDGTRGSGIGVFGNEVATYGGILYLAAGSGTIDIYTGGVKQAEVGATGAVTLNVAKNATADFTIHGDTIDSIFFADVSANLMTMDGALLINNVRGSFADFYVHGDSVDSLIYCDVSADVGYHAGFAFSGKVTVGAGGTIGSPTTIDVKGKNIIHVVPSANSYYTLANQVGYQPFFIYNEGTGWASIDGYMVSDGTSTAVACYWDSNDGTLR